LMSRAPNQQSLVCIMSAGARQYRYSGSKKLLG
jgi:hypothetical protein